MGAVKTRGRLTLSVSDLVCVYNEKDKSWQVSAWTEAELTAAEWVTDRQFLVADSLGCITMDSAEENQFMPVKEKKTVGAATTTANKKIIFQIHFDYDPPIAIPEHQYKSHFGGVYQLRVHPKRPKIFASCSVDNTIKIWNVDKDTPQRTLDEHFGLAPFATRFTQSKNSTFKMSEISLGTFSTFSGWALPATFWPRPLTTAPSACGTRRMATACTRWRSTRTRSATSQSPTTAPTSPRQGATGACTSGRQILGRW